MCRNEEEKAVNSSIHKYITLSLKAAETAYHRLVLLVGLSGSGKTAILKALAAEHGSEIVNLNLSLSRKLLELTGRQRTSQLAGIVDSIIEKGSSPVILDNIEILFDQSLYLDPLVLLQSISRNRTIIASWNGVVSDNRLFYAELGHPEYRHYESKGLLIVGMDGTATIDMCTPL
jgi:predicted AAA+ superfamily ATPase